MARVTKMDDQAKAKAETAEASAAQPTANAIDERQLVKLAQKGDKDAFETLVRRHQHRVFDLISGPHSVPGFIRLP